MTDKKVWDAFFVLKKYIEIYNLEQNRIKRLAIISETIIFLQAQLGEQYRDFLDFAFPEHVPGVGNNVIRSLGLPEKFKIFLKLHKTAP